MKNRNNESISAPAWKAAAAALAANQSTTLQDPKRLLEDLSSIVSVLCAKTPAERANCALTALVKLVPGLDMQMWREINAAQKYEGWFALDLHGGAENGKSYLQRVDPQTGLLEESLFQEALRQKAEQAHAAGVPFSLILLKIPVPLEPGAAPLVLRGASSRLWQASQPQDCLGKLAPDILGLGLAGCSSFQAVAMSESILEDLDNLAKALNLPPGLCKIGVANLERSRQPGSMPDLAKVLLENAIKALEQIAAPDLVNVRERVKLFCKKAATYENETLVLANEKQFLFFGG